MPPLLIAAFICFALSTTFSAAEQGKCAETDAISGCKTKDDDTKEENPEINGENDGDGTTLIGDYTDGNPGNPGGGPAGPEGEDERCEEKVGLGWYICDQAGDEDEEITLSDIAHFPAIPPRDSMEPNGWAIIGLPANFWATSSTHVVSGELLDRPAQVRFSPYAWHWDYGDGATRSAGTPGATWAASGKLEFDATPTSHVYSSAGTYVIRLWVDYRAEYRWNDGPWTSISGYLRLRANDLTVQTTRANTVLVEDDCTANPKGPGC